MHSSYLGPALTAVLVVGLLGFGLGFAQTWAVLVALGWAVLEVGFRLGVYLGRRGGYEQGFDDAWRQVSAW